MNTTLGEVEFRDNISQLDDIDLFDTIMGLPVPARIRQILLFRAMGWDWNSIAEEVGLTVDALYWNFRELKKDDKAMELLGLHLN